MIYDIRTSEKALKTLVNLTGVAEEIWMEYVYRTREYPYTEKMIEDVVNRYGKLPSSYRDFEFIYFHVTTSSNNCQSIKNHGIFDLCMAYECTTSELRMFLDKHEIEIDLRRKLLIYRGREYDISYSNYRVPRDNTEEYACWSIGRKFYFDYTTCGFLSVWDRSPYGGLVHRRPEILMDIDNLLGLNLSREWQRTCEPFEVIVKVSGENIVYSYGDDDSEEDKVLCYLAKGFNNIFGEPHEEVVLLKNGIQVPPKDILEIKPLECWR